MRRKTFFTTYTLFLILLFTTVTVISVYTTSNQMDMLRRRSAREYDTIATSITRDLTAIAERGHVTRGTVDNLLLAFNRIYESHYIELTLKETTGAKKSSVFKEENGRHILQISGLFVWEGFGYDLQAHFDVTDNIHSLERIQQVLLILALLFSVIGGVALYLLTNKVFQPLQIVAHATRKIANGQYHERILVTGQQEIATVATDFNKMATEVEYQMQLLKAEAVNKQQFVDNFAHEIRTPLTSVHGYAELIQKSRLTEEEVIEFTGYIMNETKHMQNIANSLLQLATLRDFEPKREKIFVSQLFAEVQQSFPSDIKFVITSKEDHLLYGQPDLIRSLLINLCKNSIHACEKDGEIQLKSEAYDNQLVLSVADNGVGIPAESLPLVTEPFYRVDSVRSNKGSGVGIGLALCKQIADVHDAMMVIHSEESVGTEVKITFTTL